MRLAIALLACAFTAPSLAQDGCTAADNVARVNGNGKCLALQTFVSAEFHEVPDQARNLNPAMVGFEPFNVALRKELASAN